MNDFPALQAAAASAIAEHNRLLTLMRSDTYSHVSPMQKANLVGRPPQWAHYVLSLGDPGPNILVTGTAEQLRARALRLLIIADRIEPVGFLR